MGFRTTRLVEYDFDCDICGQSETLYTGDYSAGICVHDINTAFRAARYHRSNGLILCDTCFDRKKCLVREESEENNNE